MSSLVLELQQAAMDANVAIAGLLRKALVVATKLDIAEFKEWAGLELKGYADNTDKIPSYRQLRGQIKATHPQYKWIPYVFEDPATAETLSRRPTHQAIGQLEHLIESATDDGVLVIPFPPGILTKIDSGNLELGIVPYLVIGKSTLYGVLDAVRNIVLEWSLRLEKLGILGEGLTFSREEKLKAANITYNIENMSGIAGEVYARDIQIGNYNAIYGELKRLGISQGERNELENILDGLDSAKEPDEKVGLVKKGMDWLLRNGTTLGLLADKIRQILQSYGA